MRRIFRADTPHDVACASLVATTLPPGENTLAVCYDKLFEQDQRPFRAALDAIVATYPWSRFVDISGLPVNRTLAGSDGRSRLGRARDFRDTVKRLAELLLEDDEGLYDEVYLNCLHHPDVQALYVLLASQATVHFYPHSFSSIDPGELELYQRWLTEPSSLTTRVRGRVVDAGKRVVAGPDALAPRHLRIDGAYSFRESLPMARHTESLADRVDRNVMHTMFRSLPPVVRAPFAALRGQCERPTVLLLLMPSEAGRTRLPPEVADQVADFALEVVDREAARTLLVKPHPRGGATITEQAIEAIRRRRPDIEPLAMTRYSALPIEIVATALDIDACAGMFTSSLWSLNRTLGIRAYHSSRLSDYLYGEGTAIAASCEAWLRGQRDSLIVL